MKNLKRIIGIDIFRGWAILLMVIFHFCYDLQHFNYIDFHIQTNLFFQWFRFLIVSMFLIAVGISLKLAHQQQINIKSLKKRAIQLGFASFMVSLGSYFIFPQTWIYFGVLHFVLLSSFIVLPLLNRPYLSLSIALSTFIAFHLNLIDMHWLFKLTVVPLHLPIDATEDVVRFVPWISFVLLGMSISTLNWHKKLFDNTFFNKINKINIFFTFMGQHALVIYLSHQVFLFGFFLLLQ